jgi:hypothetical protein
MCLDDIESVASAIREHLAANPHAADSVAGIMRWWWQPSRYVHERDRVVAALEQLVQEGVLAVRIATDGEALYSLKTQGAR